MSIWQLYYHLIWPAKDHRPLIKPDWEKELHTFLMARAQELGCVPHAINGTSTHLHLVLSIPPNLAVSEVIAPLKAESAARINQAHPEAHFAWHNSSILSSLSGTGLERLVGYVKTQKIHHSQGTTISAFEEPEKKCLP